MRLISQSCYYDISYEHHDVIVKEPVHCVTWKVSAFGDNSETEIVIGEYSTEEKALKVMEMIRGKYYTLKTYEINGQDFIKLGGFNDVEKMKKLLSPYFYMPQDSEVEA